jgi:hypothetical protein
VKTVILRSTKFWTILAIGFAFVGIQGVYAYFDGYFSQAQIFKIHGINNAYAFIEHGGMWADVFLISPVVAYIICTYRLPYLLKPGIMILVFAFVISLVCGVIYQEMGKIYPEAHTHFGYTPLIGWIHGVFAVAAIWICSMFYLTHIIPKPNLDMIAISSILTLFFILGVMKFNPNWRWSKVAIIQVSVLIILIWVTTVYKLICGNRQIK